MSVPPLFVWLAAVLWGIVILWQGLKVGALTSDVLIDKEEKRDRSDLRAVAVPSLVLSIMMVGGLILGDFIVSIWLRTATVVGPAATGVILGFLMSLRAHSRDEYERGRREN